MEFDPTQLLAAIREFGIPLAFLLGLGFAFAKRIFILGSELDRKQKMLEEQLAYREQLRLEERAGRIAAEERLGRATRALEEQAGLLHDILVEVARSAGAGLGGTRARSNRPREQG